MNWPRISKDKNERDYRFGYLDDTHYDRPFKWKVIPLIIALAFLILVWLFLTQKILFGSNWISATYDNINWRTNEGNLQTYGAWDLEAHVWKSEFIMQNWPNVFWNPYWYMGMPLFKYYQPGFYVFHIAIIKLFGMHPAKAADMLIIFGHLAAVLATFFLTLRISRRYTVSALVSTFLLANSFLSLRSYGWEPITVVFLALYPIGLLVFLREPLRPFRFWMVIALAAAYVMHPLIWFSLCMTIGIYLFSLAVSASHRKDGIAQHKIFTQYIILVLCSLLLGGFQSINQFSYQQVTSGAHMGVKYLPYYHIEYNIITLKDFFLDYTNLKGPGPIVMLALLFLAVFTISRILERAKEKRAGKPEHERRVTLYGNAMLRGIAVTLLVMVLFYYLEYFNVFPMNLLRSVQYHRIIPEFIIASACLIAAIATQLTSKRLRVFYYISIVSFVIGGLIVIYSIQTHWETAPSIEDKPEFINETIPGRISMTYTEQSLSVRNSFTSQPQIYGYYEQGITNSYDDEMFSVSSGFHNVSLTILYLRAADVSRLYVNREAGIRNIQTQQLLNGTLPYIEQNYRYAYYAIPIANPSFGQAVPEREADYVQSKAPGCRVIFQQNYCGSVGEEFVGKDINETRYLQAYVDMLENSYTAHTNYTMIDPDHYRIDVFNASNDTAIVFKMTRDRSWEARVDGKAVPIEVIGPDYMLVRPRRAGEYSVLFTYRVNVEYIIGGLLSVITFITICVYFVVRPQFTFKFPDGDMDAADKKPSEKISKKTKTRT